MTSERESLINLISSFVSNITISIDEKSKITVLIDEKSNITILVDAESAIDSMV